MQSRMYTHVQVMQYNLVEYRYIDTLLGLYNYYVHVGGARSDTVHVNHYTLLSVVCLCDNIIRLCVVDSLGVHLISLYNVQAILILIMPSHYLYIYFSFLDLIPSPPDYPYLVSFAFYAIPIFYHTY